MTTPTYRPLTDEALDYIERTGGATLSEARKLAQQARRANKLAEAAKAWKDSWLPVAEPALDEADLALLQALAAYLGET